MRRPIADSGRHFAAGADELVPYSSIIALRCLPPSWRYGCRELVCRSVSTLVQNRNPLRKDSVRLEPTRVELMSQAQRSRSVLMFVEEIYEDLELWYPRLRLIEAGFRV